MLWFIGASCVSLALGLLMAAWVRPGDGMALPVPDGNTGVDASHFTLADFVSHLVPRSIFEAMAGNEILQIVVFSLFFGVALATLREKAARITELCEELATVMLRITNYVMKHRPWRSSPRLRLRCPRRASASSETTPRSSAAITSP
jgi:Na+/H+-dicarboxylate symporter